MKNYFSIKLYKQGLKRLKSSGFVSLFVMTLLNSGYCVSMLFKKHGSGSIQSYNVAPFTQFLIPFSVFIVYTAFSYLDEQKSKDLFFGFPKKRACLFLSFSAAVYTWIIFITLFSVSANACLFILSNQYDITFSAFSEAALYYLSSISLVATVFIFGKIISSEKYMGILFSIILLYAPRKIAYEFMLEAFMKSSSATQSNSLIKWFMHSPSPFDEISNYNVKTWEAVRLFTIVTILTFAIAFVFCRMRNTSFYHSKTAKNICKAFFSTVAFVPLIFDSALYFMEYEISKNRFFKLTAYAVVFIIAMTLKDKKPKKILHSALILLIPCVLSLSLALSVPPFSRVLDKVSFTVEDIKRIEQRSVNQPAYDYKSEHVYTFTQNPELPQYMESDKKEAFEIAYSALKRGIAENRYSAVYLFEFKDGKHEYRRIYLTEEERKLIEPFMSEIDMDYFVKEAVK